MKKICFVAFIVMMLRFGAFSQTVTFSHPGGFYENSFNLELTCDGTYQIRYTTNGATPTSRSPLYTKPLILNKSLYSKSKIYTIVDCIPSKFYKAKNVDRCIIIRAAAFDDDGKCVGEVETNSYFIRSLGCDFHGMPVFSIAADSLDLFDYDNGIFVPGKHYDKSDKRHTGNYYERGRGWEREINLEFYETDNSGVNQRCGLRTHGNASRWFQQKGMKLYARKEYGKKRFNHEFFPDSPYNSFKHLTLHPFRCSVWLETGAQEYISHQLVAGLDIDASAVRQVTVFLNGEYWGIYTLEETPDEHFLENHYSIDFQKANIIKYFELQDYGDRSDWLELFDWISQSDLSLPADSAIAYNRFDVPNLIDYMLLEIFSANLDWPQNNVRLWQYEAGKPFRLIFFDADGCFIRYTHNAMYHAMHSGRNSIVLNHFLQNKHFKRAFYNRYLELKSSKLSYDSMKNAVEKYRAIVIDEVPKQSKRFGFPKDMKTWERDMDSINNFIARRHTTFEEEFYTIFPVGETDITYLTCYPNPQSKTIDVCLNSLSEDMVNVSIYKCFGGKMQNEYRYVYEGSNVIRMSLDLPAGVYVVKVNNLTQRIIIQ